MTEYDEDSVAATDRALDALVAGDRAEWSDPTLGLLAVWRDDLGTDPPVFNLPRPPRAPTPPRTVVGRPRRRRVGRASRLVVATGVAAIATTGLVGVAMASANARPGSALFSVTKVIYPDQAAYQERLAIAQRDLSHARAAAAEGRDDDARRFLDDADRHARNISHPDADRVHRAADQVRQDLDPPPGTGPVPDPPPVQPSEAASSAPSTSPPPSEQASGSPSPSVSPSTSAAADAPTAGGAPAPPATQQ